jgi:hypothetical protein
LLPLPGLCRQTEGAVVPQVHLLMLQMLSVSSLMLLLLLLQLAIAICHMSWHHLL